MRVELFDVDKFVTMNKLKQVTEPLLFNKGYILNDKGLLSTEIFGTSVTERRRTFAYIDLKGHFLHPFIYKILKRMDKRIDSVISGRKLFKIKDGELVEDENGNTGSEWLYRNWDSIKFKRNNSTARTERINVLEFYKKDILFVTKWIVIPAFYRDVNLQGASSGKISHNEINDKYTKLIRDTSMLDSSSSFDFVLHNTRYVVQNSLVDIYDFLKGKLDRKQGLIRKSLLGKSIDYGSRSVISAPTFDCERYDEMNVDFYHVSLPLSQCCSLFAPFVIRWVKNYFDRELFKLKEKYPVSLNGKLTYVKLDNPESVFSDDYIKKQIDRFVHAPYNRFDKIELPIKDEDKPIKVKKYFLSIKGRSVDSDTENPLNDSTIIDRPATWTDILYQACEDVTKDKHVVITRYPLVDYFGIFPNKIFVQSTKQTMVVNIGGKVYKNYPVITEVSDKALVGGLFIDTISMSNLYLTGLGGDYDGDQVSARGLFTQEANIEADKLLRAKTNFVDICGQTNRVVAKEGVQTLFMLTRFND